jgi:hypothetical protein
VYFLDGVCVHIYVAFRKFSVSARQGLLLRPRIPVNLELGTFLVAFSPLKVLGRGISERFGEKYFLSRNLQGQTRVVYK